MKHYLNRYLLVFFLLISQHAAASTQLNYSQAYTAFIESRYQDIHPILMQATLHPTLRAEALYNIGVQYHYGIGIEKDLQKAAHFFRHSAILNYPYAAQALAQLHYHGSELFEKNINAARFWWNKAVELNQVDALLSLGSLVNNSNVYQKDTLLSLVLINKALEAGHPQAESYNAWLQQSIYQSRKEDSDWIKSQDISHYTIEFFEGENEIDAREFKARLNLPSARIYRKKNSNWVVIAGHYKSKYLADLAVKNISSDFHAYNPRRRSYIEVQAELLPENPVVGSDWLQQRDPNRFSVLLKVAEAESVARDFIVFNGLQYSALFKTTQGQYFVAAGVFDTQEDANNAVSQLPQNLKNENTRVVSFGELQAVLDKTPIAVQVPYTSPIGLRFSFGFDRLSRYIQLYFNKEESQLNMFLEDQPSLNQPALVGEIENQYVAPPMPVLYDNDWLKQRTGEEYAVQLFTGESKQQLLDTSAYLGIQSGSIYPIAGGYAMSAGVFPSLEQTQNVIQGLPETIRSLNPSAKKFSEIIASLDAQSNDNVVNAIQTGEQTITNNQNNITDIQKTLNNDVDKPIKRGANEQSIGQQNNQREKSNSNSGWRLR